MTCKVRILKDITDFIFISDEPETADILFIPGGSYPETAERAARIYHETNTPFILPSGKYSIKLGVFPGPKSRREVYSREYPTEWEFLKEVLVCHGVRENAILREDQSTNTYENSLFSRKATDALGLPIRKAMICCKSFHARRCLMYYQMAYPQAKLLVCPTDVQGISRDNWFNTEIGIQRVMGELERCGKQFPEMIKKWMIRDSHHVNP